MDAATSRRCGICGYVQRLRVDGTLGRHHIWFGHEYAGECPGTGKTPEATAQERAEFRELMRRGT